MSESPRAAVIRQRGRWFEELRTGVVYQYAPGRTIGEADNTLFTTLTMNPQSLHHLRQPRVSHVAAVEAGADHGRDHPLDPGAFPRRGCGVDDLLHVAGLDFLAGDRVDDRGGEPLAQAALGVRVLAGPPTVNGKPVQVPGGRPCRGPVVGILWGSRR
jgi:hypothetical protein